MSYRFFFMWEQSFYIYLIYVPYLGKTEKLRMENSSILRVFATVARSIVALRYYCNGKGREYKLFGRKVFFIALHASRN
jgi:hypothetical protein